MSPVSLTPLEFAGGERGKPFPEQLLHDCASWPARSGGCAQRKVSRFPECGFAD